MKTITIEVSEKGLEDLKKQLELEKAKPKRWRAQKLRLYWYLDDYGNVTNSTENNDYVDNWRYSQRNYFQMEEEAEKYKKYLECVAKIKDSSDFKHDWYNTTHGKYCIGYDHKEDELVFCSSIRVQTSTIVHYETEEQAQQAMKDLKDEYEYVFAYERGEA